MQRLRGFDDDEKSEESIYGDRLARRKTIQNLEKRKTQKPRIGTLDVAFRKRFLNINAQEGEHKVAGAYKSPIFAYDKCVKLIFSFNKL